jgi:hypothetical protein
MKNSSRRILLAAGLLAGAGLGARLDAQEHTNFLFNGDFEQTVIYSSAGKNKHPHNLNAAEQYLMPEVQNAPNSGKGPAIYSAKGGQYAYFLDELKPRSGRYAICVKNVDPAKTGPASLSWIGVPIRSDKYYTLAGWVKAEQATDVQLYYSMNGAAKQVTGFKKFLGEGTFEWKPFLVEIRPDQTKLGYDVKTVDIKLINAGTGSVWFDNVYLEEDTQNTEKSQTGK